jgi:predicted transcriptional regulator
LHEQAFMLNVVHGKTCRQIAELLGINKETASIYIREESKRRTASLDAERDSQTARAVAFYDNVAAIGIELAQKSHEPFMQQLIKGLDTAVKARERKDKLLGLDAPTKIEVGLEDLLKAVSAGDDPTKLLE